MLCKKLIQRVSISSCVLVSGLCGIAFAQTPPSAGTLLREQAPAQAVPPKGTATLPQAAELAGLGTDTTPIEVKRLRVTGSTVYPAEVLEALVADIPGTNHTLRELQLAAARVTAYYRKAGYSLARAYLPQQKMQDGVVTIDVLEGKLEKVQIDNGSRLSDEMVRDRLARVEAGSVFLSSTADRALLLLSDTPGVGPVDSRLAPGSSRGESVLVTKLAEAPLFTGRLDGDNHGGLYTGRNRLALSGDLNSPLGHGEKFSARIQGSDGKLLNGRLAAQLPVGNNGLTVGGAVAHTTYLLGDAFASLDAVGHSTTAELNVRYPWIRSVNANLYTQAGYEYRKLHDEVRSTDTVTEKHANVGSVSLIGDLRDGLGGGGITQGSLTVSAGKLGFDNSSAAAIDSVNAKTAGNYTKLTYSVERQQALPASFSLSLQVRGQWADSNLDSSEKFSLGGPYGVRAYATSEAMGDRGWFASAELRYAVTPWLSANAFHDHGSVEVNAKPYLMSANTLHRSGNGIGVVGNYGDFDWRAYAAWRGNEASTAEPDKRPRFWLQAGWRF